MPAIKSSLLVWIFAITQLLNAPQRKRQIFGKIFRLNGLLAQIIRDGAVIAGGMLESESRETPPRLFAHFALFAPFQHHRLVILRAHQHDDMLKVLGWRRPE